MKYPKNVHQCIVVPHAGPWIEIDFQGVLDRSIVVPHAGTWIEIRYQLHYIHPLQSFPTRERGLKYVL